MKPELLNGFISLCREELRKHSLCVQECKKRQMATGAEEFKNSVRCLQPAQALLFWPAWFGILDLERLKENATAAKHRKNNPESVRAANQKSRKNNGHKHRARACQKACEWQKENRERANANKSAHIKRKRAADKSYQIELNQRSRIFHALFSQGAKKVGRTLEILGVKSRQEFFDLMSAKLPPEWTWENYGTVWELDHKRPCASFDLSDSEQLKQCFHHSNYQPLSVHDNRSKGDKWEGPDAQ